MGCGAHSQIHTVTKGLGLKQVVYEFQQFMLGLPWDRYEDGPLMQYLQQGRSIVQIFKQIAFRLDRHSLGAEAPVAEVSSDYRVAQYMASIIRYQISVQMRSFVLKTTPYVTTRMAGHIPEVLRTTLESRQKVFIEPGQRSYLHQLV